MPSPTHLLVGNPTAQSGRNAERIARARELLGRAGIGAQLLPTLPEGRTVAAVRDALEAGPWRAVIAMGGDGTFREVAAGLYASSARERVPLAMLPTGTANDQGKSFGLAATPEALERNVAVIAAARETRLDVGLFRANPGASAGEATCFFDSAGWGLSARVLAQRNLDRKAVEELGGPLKELYRDHAVYAGALLTTFIESYVVDDKFRAVVHLDGATTPVVLEGLTDLVVKNTRVYAGAWVLDRTAAHDDGAFELVPFQGKRDWTSKAIVDLDGNPLGEEILNELGISHSRPMRASRIEMTLTAPEGAPLATQLDGEEWPVAAQVRIDVVRQGLRLIVGEAPGA